MIHNDHSKINSTQDVFNLLKIKSNLLSNKKKKHLHDNGYLVLESTKFLRNNLGKLRREVNKLIKKEGVLGGWDGKREFYKKGKMFEPGTNRLGNLIEKNKVFADLITIPELLLGAKEVIGDDIKVCGLNLREPIQGTGEQKIHIDWKPRKNKKEKYSGVVCMIHLDNSTEKNGSTRIIPKTHKKLGWPEEHIDIYKRNKHEIRPAIKAGSIVIVNLNLWHAGSINISGKNRRMIMVNIKRRSLPQLLNYKKFLSKKTKNKLNEVQKYLLAIRNSDKTQKKNSVGVGKYYKGAFHYYPDQRL
jgi:hypothetical protein